MNFDLKHLQIDQATDQILIQQVHYPSLSESHVVRPTLQTVDGHVIQTGDASSPVNVSGLGMLNALLTIGEPREFWSGLENSVSQEDPDRLKNLLQSKACGMAEYSKYSESETEEGGDDAKGGKTVFRASWRV